VLFGLFRCAIAGAVLVGPVFAAQFRIRSGLIWLVGGVCIAGARAGLHLAVGVDAARGALS
jgi:carbon starvation protein CstA